MFDEDIFFEIKNQQRIIDIGLRQNLYLGKSTSQTKLQFEQHVSYSDFESFTVGSQQSLLSINLDMDNLQSVFILKSQRSLMETIC